jgi:RHS repeat-associated protein
VSAEGSAVAVDRLGSVRWSTMASHTYYPYGVEYTATANDMEKYATYTRDTLTGLDYAVNRYYSSIWGRFTSPDPYGGSVRLSNPQSWNRYSYVTSDPVNGHDPSGLDDAIDCPDDAICLFDDGGGGGGVGGAVGGSFTSGDVTGTQTSGFGVLTDPNGNPIPLPIVGDPNTTNAANQVTVIGSPWTTPPPDFSGSGIDPSRGSIGWNADPIGPEGPNPYSPTDTYSGIFSQCMFQIGGSGSWSNTVRGCLAALYLATPPEIPYAVIANQDHAFCYWAADQKTGEGLAGYSRAVVGALGCMLGQMPVFTGPNLIMPIHPRPIEPSRPQLLTGYRTYSGLGG